MMAAVLKDEPYTPSVALLCRTPAVSCWLVTGREMEGGRRESAVGEISSAGTATRVGQQAWHRVHSDVVWARGCAVDDNQGPKCRRLSVTRSSMAAEGHELDGECKVGLQQGKVYNAQVGLE